MAMTDKGIITPLENGQEQHETFTNRITKKTFVQYDYRHTDGELFSCVAKTLAECRDRRNAWLIGKIAKSMTGGDSSE